MGFLENSSRSARLVQEYTLRCLCCGNFPNCACGQDVKAPRHLRNFEADLENVRGHLDSIASASSIAMPARKLSPSLLEIFRDFHYSSLIMLSLFHDLNDSSQVDLIFQSQRLALFQSRALTQLCKELFYEHLLRPVSVQILEWLLFYLERYCSSLKHYVDVSSDAMYIRNQLLLPEHGKVKDLLIDFISKDLIDSSFLGPEAVTKCLNSYFHLVSKQFSGRKIFEKLKLAYRTHVDEIELTSLNSSDQFPCEAQIMANLGTGFISHKPSYVLGSLHVKLAQYLFEEALSLLPVDVCKLQREHLTKNIRISKIVPSVLDTVLSILTSDVSENKPHGSNLERISSSLSKDLECTFEEEKLRDVFSAIKFVIQMVSNNCHPAANLKQTLNKQMLESFLAILEQVNPELSKRCFEWALNTLNRTEKQSEKIDSLMEDCGSDTVSYETDESNCQISHE